MIVNGISRGVGTSIVSVPPVTLTQAAHAAVVECDSDALDVLDRSPFDPSGWTPARRIPIGTDCGGS